MEVGQVQEAEGFTGGDEMGGDGGDGVEVLGDELGLDLIDVSDRGAVG